jgi:hypothetical protein
MPKCRWTTPCGTRLAIAGSSQRLAEQYRHTATGACCRTGSLPRRTARSPAGQAAPRAATRDLRASLDALLEDWRPLVQAGNEDEDIRRAAPRAVPEELEDPRWGLFSADRAGCWPVPGPPSARPWQRQGRRSWPAGCRACWARKPAPSSCRHVQRPEDLAEQLPRIEAVQAWLHHARQVLDLPQRTACTVS